MNKKITTLIFSTVVIVSHQASALRTIDELFQDPRIDFLFSKQNAPDYQLMGLDPEQAKSFTHKTLSTTIENPYNELSTQFTDDRVKEYETKLEIIFKKILAAATNQAIEINDIDQFTTLLKSLVKYLSQKHGNVTPVLQFTTIIISRIITIVGMEIGIENPIAPAERANVQATMTKNLAPFNDAFTKIITELFANFVN